ncbi:MAG: ABC transporter permease [Lachnospiraceae bacterium]|nr:ABC transporter permease [Lachnospiraceae bacterium]
MEHAVNFESNSFGKRLKSMLKVDFRRMCKSKHFYILIACALVIPILITVMMTMMDGSVSVNPQTGEETVMEGPENAWQSIGTLPTEGADGGEAQAMGGMDVMSMCNINMMFMLAAVFICLFISEDFKSGYAKNLFTVRVRKGDYVISKTLAGFVCGALMLLAYFIGAMLGGAISGLSFDLGTLNAGNIVMCMLAKVFLMLVFVPIFVLVSVAAKQKTWLCLCGSLAAGMLLFMMVSMITPLSSTMINVALCLAGGALFSVGLGAISNAVLKKTSLV